MNQVVVNISFDALLSTIYSVLLASVGALKHESRMRDDGINILYLAKFLSNRVQFVSDGRCDCLMRVCL